jgi:hypothetical protein
MRQRSVQGAQRRQRTAVQRQHRRDNGPRQQRRGVCDVAGLVDKPEYLNKVYGITNACAIYDDAGKLPPESQAFVDLVGKKLDQYSNAPLFAAMIGAGLAEHYADGVNRAQSFEPEKVKAALETMGPFTTAFGTFNYRAPTTPATRSNRWTSSPPGRTWATATRI